MGGGDLLGNLSLFIDRITLGRILLMSQLYQKILTTEGIVMEFGVKYGQNISLFQKYRHIFEPYNWKRKIVAFDTFEGLYGVSSNDNQCQNGDFSTPPSYENFLNEIMQLNEQESAISHIKRYEIIKGDASQTFPQYLKANPQTIISLIYFDMDIYQPTLDVLKFALPRMSKGSIIAFDEVNDSRYPGETMALLESLNIQNYKIHKNPSLEANTCWIEL